MSVLKGEGRVPILYGAATVPVGRHGAAYHGRPDLGGSHPTVLVAHGAAGLTPSVKSLVRRLARYGYSTIAPDLGHDPARHLHDAASWVRRPGTEWADGDRMAVVLADESAQNLWGPTHRLEPRAIVVLFGDLRDVDPTDVPFLGVYGGADEEFGADAVRNLRSVAPHGTWAIYQDRGHGFTDEDSESYDRPAAEDAAERIVAFLDDRLLPAAASAG